MTGFWQRWMIAWCWITIGFGAAFALAAFTSTRTPALVFMDVVFWPIDGQPAALSREAALSTALCGAIMIGWGTLMLGLARDPELSRMPQVWRLMTAGMIAWFVVDSIASWVTGAGVNVIGNSLFLGTYLWPVVQSGVLTDEPRAQRAT